MNFFQTMNDSKRLFFILPIIFWLGLFYSCEKKETRVFLVAGQSNAMGVGNHENSIFIANKEVFEYSSIEDTLKLLRDPVGEQHLYFETAKTGSFTPALAYNYAEITNHKVVMIAAAKGGSSLTVNAELNNWGNWSEDGKLFNSSIAKSNSALAKLNLKKIDAIFWSQGESEGEALANNLITPLEYKKALIHLIDRYRKIWGEIPFLIIETGNFKGDVLMNNGYRQVRKIQREVAQQMNNVHIGYNETEFFIKRDWLLDGIHYNQEALNEIGKKLAYFYASLDE